MNEELYPAEYLKTCSKELYNLLIDTPDEASDSALEYFKSLYENTRDIWPNLANDCIKETLELVRTAPKYMKENTINLMVNAGRYISITKELNL